VQVPEFHWQVLEQVSISVPQLPQGRARVAFGAHGPWLAQAPRTHWQLDEQVSVSEPQLPHA
jgi:hypothetical protein